MSFVLSRYSASSQPHDFTDAEAIAAVARITNGNFRLVRRLFAWIRRVRELNQLNTITAEVVEAARETLLIASGAPSRM